MIDLRRNLDKTLQESLQKSFFGVSTFGFRQDISVAYSLTEQLSIFFDSRARVFPS